MNYLEEKVDNCIKSGGGEKRWMPRTGEHYCAIKNLFIGTECPYLDDRMVVRDLSCGQHEKLREIYLCKYEQESRD